MSDETTRRRVRTALEDSEGLQTVFRHSPAGILVLNSEGQVLRVNPAIQKTLMIPEKELLNRNVTDLLSESELEEFRAVLGSLVSGDKDVVDRITRFRRNDGLVVYGVTTLSAVRDQRKRFLYVLGMVQDITARREAEQALKAQTRILQSVLDSMSDGVLVTNSAGQLILYNREAEVILGAIQEDTHPKDWVKTYGLLETNTTTPIKEEQFPLVRAIAGEKVDGLEMFLRNKNVPEGRYLSVSGRPLRDELGELRGGVLVIREITERWSLEEQFRQAQKMEAVGRLAGGIAHDFNNLLFAIIGYSDLILSNLPEGDELRTQVEEIRKAGNLAASLTRRLLTLSRRQVMKPKLVNLNDVVKDMDKMLRRMIGEDIELITPLDPKLGEVMVDPGQIEQVILNMAVNARDALPKGGKLIIETSNVRLDEAMIRGKKLFAPGAYAMLAISDTGSGMDRGTLTHIFEPFFTTKEPGRGTGLGLATVYGIVKQSEGYISVYSEVDQGTTFKIYFPRASKGKESSKNLRTTPAEVDPGGSETILLVEDERMVRDLAFEILKGQGYDVIVCEDAEKAHTLLGKHKGKIDLLLTDVVMPKMSGPALVEKIGDSRPGMRVIYMSGYTGSAVLHHGVMDPNAAFLQKPISPSALSQKVREVLDEERPALR